MGNISVDDKAQHKKGPGENKYKKLHI